MGRNDASRGVGKTKSVSWMDRVKLSGVEVFLLEGEKGAIAIGGKEGCRCRIIGETCMCWGELHADAVFIFTANVCAAKGDGLCSLCNEIEGGEAQVASDGINNAFDVDRGFVFGGGCCRL